MFKHEKRRKFMFNTFPNKSDFQVDPGIWAHGTYEDHRVEGFSTSGSLITIQMPKNVTKIQESVGQSQYRSL